MARASLRVLRVFIASPSDLADERLAARQVVDGLNRGVAHPLAWHVELLGWEDTLPTFARAQEAINKDVDDCELFVGVLWKRWGQPTGDYSSGFEEEYRRATKRRSSDGAPDVWLFFRQVPAELLDDPGSQLQQVLHFKREEAGRQTLYKEFDDLDDWKSKLWEYLASHLLSLAQSAAAPPTEDEAPSGAPSTDDSRGDRVEGGDTSLRQTQAALATFQRALGGDEDLDLDAIASLKFFLFASAWLSMAYTNEVLGAHEMNLAYKHRRDFELLFLEAHLVSRTLVGAQVETIPGWFWFRDEDRHRTRDRLQRHLADEESVVRRGALQLMRPAALRPSDNDVVHKLLTDPDRGVRLETYAWLADQGRRRDASALETALPKLPAEEQDDARAALAVLLARFNPDASLQTLIDSETPVPAEGLQILLDSHRRIRRRTLNAALASRQSSLRSLAVRLLAPRGALSREQLVALITSDPSHPVREALIDIALEKRWSLSAIPFDAVFPEKGQSSSVEGSDAARAKVKFLGTYSYDELVARLDWYELEAQSVLEALGSFHSPKSHDLLITELESDFEPLRERSLACVTERDSAAAATYLHREFERRELVEFVRSQLARGTLAGLSKHPPKRLIQAGLDHLGHPSNDVRTEAIEIVRRVGSRRHADKLLDVARESWLLRDRALAACAELAPGAGALTRELLSSDEPEYVLAGIAALREGRTSKTQLRLLQGLLLHDNGEARRRAAEILVELMDRKDLETLLDDYVAQRRYYYQVVAIFDRALYAPSAFADGHRSTD